MVITRSDPNAIEFGNFLSAQELDKINQLNGETLQEIAAAHSGF